MRRLLIGLIVLILLLVVAFFAISTVIYTRVAAVEANCEEHPEEKSNTPASFTRENFDTTPYRVENYEEVSFPSRDADLTISGWYIPADEENAPAVIVVHGVSDCKRRPFVLTAAGMLHNNGFNVLLIDMRDHGDSEIEDGRHAGGTEEYQDILGAWDWLIAEKGIPQEKIGIMGFSLGAATTIMATGEEPRVAAAWADSSFASIEDIIQDELARNNFPGFFGIAATTVGKLISGDDITSNSPLEAVKKLDGRPLFIVHGNADERVKLDYAYDLADGIRADGGEIDPWIVPDTAHIEAIFNFPEEYEQRLISFFSQHLK